jgi:hypothetical protein
MFALRGPPMADTCAGPPLDPCLRGGDGHDVGNLVWLREKLGEDLLDALVLTTGSEAYRRADGIGVVPLALLGP